MEELLLKIKDFADKAHGDQMRKYTPERYIVHPERVMLICREYVTDIPVQAAALLHDVLEDTPVTSAEIEQFLTELMPQAQARKTLELVEELTDVYIKKDFPHLNRKSRKEMETTRLSKTSAAAQTIKYADLIDNAFDILKHDPQFGRKFINEARCLLKHMKNGNAELRQRAIKTLDKLS
ncbi:HD domain-containing protein [Flavihumibacter sp. R14]|nr:HD domain-containing protein [Flavihumibacter soli]